MAKQSYEIKLKIFQSYLNCEGGYRFLAEKYGVADFKKMLTKVKNNRNRYSYGIIIPIGGDCI